jgi:hypothetical protein
MSFDALVERGDDIIYPYFSYGLEDKAVKWIWFMSPEYVFRWIIDIALGIA